MRPAIRRENVSALWASAAQIVVKSAAASTLTLEQMNPLQDNFYPPSLLGSKQACSSQILRQEW